MIINIKTEEFHFVGTKSRIPGLAFYVVLKCYNWESWLKLRMILIRKHIYLLYPRFPYSICTLRSSELIEKFYKLTLNSGDLSLDKFSSKIRSEINVSKKNLILSRVDEADFITHYTAFSHFGHKTTDVVKKDFKYFEYTYCYIAKFKEEVSSVLAWGSIGNDVFYLHGGYNRNLNRGLIGAHYLSMLDILSVKKDCVLNLGGARCDQDISEKQRNILRYKLKFNPKIEINTMSIKSISFRGVILNFILKLLNKFVKFKL